MKNRLFAVLFLLLGTDLFATAADDYALDGGRGLSDETFVTKVTRDLSFKNGGVIYVAYLVKWKDHEVLVVDDHEFQKHYAVGDSIPCKRLQDGTFRDGPGKGYDIFYLAPASTIRMLAGLQANADRPLPHFYGGSPIRTDGYSSGYYLSDLADMMHDRTELAQGFIHQRESDKAFLAQVQYNYTPVSEVQKRSQALTEKMADLRAKREPRPATPAPAGQKPPSASAPESSVLSELFTATVIKDLSFKDDDAQYVAYLVNWRGHEIVVTGNARMLQHHAAGDPIPCEMMQRYASSRSGNILQGQFSFSSASGLTSGQLARAQASSAESVIRYAKIKQAKTAATTLAQQPVK